MRRMMLCAALAAVACGSDSTKSAGGVTGTISGKSFTPVETVAFNAGPASCSFAGTTLSISALGLAFSPQSGSCGLFTTGACNVKAGSSAALLFVANVSGKPVGTGTYDVVASPEALIGKVLPSGTAAIGTSETFPSSTGACTAAAHGAVGSVTITSIDASRVKGHVDVTLGEGAGSVKGDFDASLCAAPELCSLIVGYVGTAGNGVASSPVCGGGFTCQ